MLTLKEVETLLAPKSPAQDGKWFDGFTWHNGKPAAHDVGAFTGRAGSMRRSSKGRSYRLSNGRRAYVINPDSEVIAYLA